MRRISDTEQTLFAQLIQQCLDAAFDIDFPENGSFTQLKRNERAYWYYQGYEPSGPKGRGRKVSKYVGPVSDPEVTRRVQQFAAIKSDYKERTRLVSMLKTAGLPTPPAIGGDVVEALWKGGAFRLRGVLVGTVAFQAYAGLLGFRFPSAQIMTLDVDVAQFYSISAFVDDSLPPILPLLRTVDPSFSPIPARDGSAASTMFINAGRFRLDFLTPNEGSDSHTDHPASMPALGGASAQPLRYLGFLIRDPLWSVLLHKSGVLVRVPAPERFAVHKLILSEIRKADPENAAKAQKDLRQAETLLQAIGLARRHELLGDAWLEAWQNGKKWSRRLAQSASGLSDTAIKTLSGALQLVTERDGLDPAQLGGAVFRNRV